MTIRDAWLKRIGLVSATVMAGAITGFFVVDALRAGGQEDSSRTGTFLQTTNRTELAICVDVINQEPVWIGTAIERLTEAWPAIVAHPTWEKLGVTYPDPVIRPECPGTPYVLDRWEKTEVASPYFLHVYVVDASVIEGSEPAAGYPEESLCVEDACSQVTSGLYIVPEVLEFSELLQTYVVMLLGLERPGPVELPDEWPSAAITPEPTHTDTTPIQSPLQ